MNVRHAIIIPACDEAPCIEETLREIAAEGLQHCGVVVGVNGSSDATADLARSCGVEVAETDQRGYGHGCTKAIARAKELWPQLDSFIFFSADGSNVAADVRKLLAARSDGAGMVLGRRTRSLRNLRVMGITHTLANRILGAACGLLTGRFFYDLGPLRLIARSLLDEIDPVEMTYGWTIEAQVRASLLNARAVEVDVIERARRAGEQKVSRVSLMRTIQVGVNIFAAGFRSRVRPFGAECEGSRTEFGVSKPTEAAPSN